MASALGPPGRAPARRPGGPSTRRREKTRASALAVLHTSDPPVPPAVPGPETAARLEIVVGIDPGTRVLGYGALVVGARGPRFYAAGVLRANSPDVPTRLGALRAELDLLFQRLKPTVIVVEQAFAARNVQSALRIGEGRGVVLGCAAATGARIVQFAPAVAKKALAGSGAADKSQVARMVEQILGAKSKGLPLDASDALALALAFTTRSRVLPVDRRASTRRRAV